MENNNDKVIFKTRLPVDRRQGKNRRLFLEQEHLDHPERRVSMIDRRMTGDRRRMLAEFLKTFLKEDL